MTVKVNEANRALAMKEYFGQDELDIIHHALNEYAKKLQADFPGYSLTMQTLILKEIFARQ